MKKLILLVMLTSSMVTISQNNDQLFSHYKNYYQQMKKQGDVQGVINALTHLNVIRPTQSRIDTLAFVYVAEGRYIEALNTVGVENAANDSNLNSEVKAVALKSLNQPKRALVFYEKLYKTKPNPLLAYEMADLKTQIGDLDGALENIEFGMANATDDMKRSFYESQQPYQVSLEAALKYLKGLVVYNQNNSENIDKAILLLDEALAIEPNFNMAMLSKNALLAKKNPPETEKKN